MNESRVKKSLINAKVNLLFYFLSLFFSFFSRKIFLENLGDDFIGLTGTLGNILGYLNLAEFGIGNCISFFLYKPIQAGNRDKINEIISVFGYLYRKIGQVIFVGAILLSLFFPLIFGHTNVGLGIIYFAFYSFLFSSLIGYFINYRQILLSADQKDYLVAIYFQSANLIKTGIQIALAYYYKNYYIWVVIEFVFSIIGCIVLNWKIDKEYPWLKTRIHDGKLLLKKYPEIITNTKQVFIHKIKDFLLVRSDEILIFAFVSLKMVAYYGNYMMIISKLNSLFAAVLNGVNAGVGNLVAEGNKAKTMKVFWELMSIRYFVAGVVVFSIFIALEPFISIWLGSEYILGRSIFVLLLIYIFIMNSRGVVDMFNHSFGLYADTWSAWVELILNVGITIGAGMYYGISGILLGKIVSTFLIVVLWKPYYLYSKGLKLSISVYWSGTLRYYILFIISFVIAYAISKILPIDPYSGYFSLISFSACAIGFFVVIYVVLLYMFALGMKECIHRFIKLKV